ncbi:hypothetical protein HDU67_007169, partial [Dinochytrium kinnereticum]
MAWVSSSRSALATLLRTRLTRSYFSNVSQDSGLDLVARMEQSIKSGSLDSAVDIFSSLRQTGKPSEAAYILLLKECSRIGDHHTATKVAADMRSFGLSAGVEAQCLLLGAHGTSPNVKETDFIETSMKMIKRFPSMLDKLAEIAVPRMLKFHTERSRKAALDILKLIPLDKSSPLFARYRIRILGQLKQEAELQDFVQSLKQQKLTMEQDDGSQEASNRIMVSAEILAAFFRLHSHDLSGLWPAFDDLLKDLATVKFGKGGSDYDRFFVEALRITFAWRLERACSESLRAAIATRATLLLTLQQTNMADLDLLIIRDKLDNIFVQYLLHSLEQFQFVERISENAQKFIRAGEDHFGGTRLNPNPSKNYIIWSNLMLFFIKCVELWPERYTVDHAIDKFRSFKRDGFRPGRKDFHSLMELAATRIKDQRDRVTAVKSLFDEMERTGVRVTASSFSPLFIACAPDFQKDDRIGRYSPKWRQFEEDMLKRGIQHSRNSIQSILIFLARSNLFGEIENRMADVRLQQLRMSLGTYRMIFHYAARSSQSSRYVLHQLRHIFLREVPTIQPDEILYERMLACCSKSGDVALAMELLTEM